MTTTALIQQLAHRGPEWPSWLLRRYQDRTLRQAIAQVYPAFAQQYPDWVNYLFDEQFLNNRAFSLLAHYLENDAMPTSYELARVWAEQFSWFNSEVKRRHLAELTPVAADFLRRLDQELFN